MGAPGETSASGATETPCILWHGLLDHRGYGRHWLPGRGYAIAHRVAYERAKGTIPTGLMVLHHCDVRACVNPDHLFVGTAKDNMQDALSKGRMVIPRQHGETNGRARLTSSQVQEIRARHQAGQSGRSLARLYGVGSTTVRHIVAGRNWAREVAK